MEEIASGPVIAPVLAIADAPAALECSGTGGANRNLAYALTLTALEGNSVVVEDLERGESCTCVFRHDNFFDQSQGVVQQYIVQLKYQLCATECSSTMKRQINASIRVYHRLLGKRSDATPFVGNGAANCDASAWICRRCGGSRSNGSTPWTRRRNSSGG
jgi:hypothetical protein